ncbi:MULTISPECIES: ABC transporter permease [Rhizobium]|nr:MULTISPECIES: ABC transporter permease subunit [Rhizobium]KWV40912.1 ABC transporter permease [Rhizobium altiplani]KWV48029.1 ABC transporter permease [Rhizobium altiplani]KWV54193.1 ABC transporter permease [Rhizobium altiplani]KWV54937.1 ABC transporter permease [Rhizobium altiplani]
MDLVFLEQVMQALLEVLPVTVALFAISVTAGGLLALLLTYLRVSNNAAARGFARSYIFVFRGSPLLMQMFLLYYGLGQFPIVRHSVVWPILREPFYCACISLALCTAGYTAEVFRGGLRAVPPKEVEAGKAYGMSGFLLFRRIVGPIAFRHCLPAYSTELVSMMKSTSLASLVTVWEVTGIANKMISSTYRTFEIFLCAAAIYLLLNFLLVQALGMLERRLSPHLRARPTGVETVQAL